MQNKFYSFNIVCAFVAFLAGGCTQNETKIWEGAGDYVISRNPEDWNLSSNDLKISGNARAILSNANGFLLSHPNAIISDVKSSPSGNTMVFKTSSLPNVPGERSETASFLVAIQSRKSEIVTNAYVVWPEDADSIAYVDDLWIELTPKSVLTNRPFLYSINSELNIVKTKKSALFFKVSKADELYSDELASLTKIASIKNENVVAFESIFNSALFDMYVVLLGNDILLIDKKSTKVLLTTSTGSQSVIYHVGGNSDMITVLTSSLSNKDSTGVQKRTMFVFSKNYEQSSWACKSVDHVLSDPILSPSREFVVGLKGSTGYMRTRSYWTVYPVNADSNFANASSDVVMYDRPFWLSK